MPISKEMFDNIVSGRVKKISRPITPYWCKRLKGCGRICAYALPSPSKGERICQLNGQKCISGTNIQYKQLRFRKGVSNISHLVDITKMKCEWDKATDKMQFCLEFENN